MPTIGDNWTEKEDLEHAEWLKKLGISGGGLDAEIHSIFYNILGGDLKKANECTEKCLGATEEQYEEIVLLMQKGATFDSAYKFIMEVFKKPKTDS
tara:strand:- start:2742 stop:3029 length:288 start_codon:yes stop_codon:yes gene_type:complete